MRVLVLSDTPFRPPAAGNRRRIDAMLGYLRGQGAAVGMLMLPAVDRAEWDVASMAAALDHLEITEPPPRTLAARLVTVGRRLLARPGAPVGVDDWCPRWFRARAATFAARWAADIVLVEYVYLSACLPALGGGCVRVIDTHDVMSRRAQVYAAAGLPPQWFHTTWAEEARGLARADVVLAITEDDARMFRPMAPGGIVLTVPHAEPVMPAPVGRALSGRLLFVASYNDLNVIGLRWFLDAVWPALRATVPRAELVVCGNIAAKLGPVPAGVAVRGFVPQLADEYAAARVVVNPVREGTGLKVKVVEALCHGRPVVTTRAGAAGLDADGVLVADAADDCVRTLRTLLTDAAAWVDAAGGAARHAARRFSPEVAFAPLVRQLDELVARRRGGGSAAVRRRPSPWSRHA